MLVNAIEGVVENGKIRLREEVVLPENTRVFVLVGDLHLAAAAAHIHSPRLADPKQAAIFRKTVTENAADAEV